MTRTAYVVKIGDDYIGPGHSSACLVPWKRARVFYRHHDAQAALEYSRLKGAVRPIDLVEPE